MTESKTGIYTIPLGWTTVYLVKGKAECLLVDTAWDSEYTLDAIKRQMASVGLRLTDITQCVITHIHPDHYGLAGRLRQATGAKLLMHRREIDLIHKYASAGYAGEVTEWLRSHGVPEVENLGPHPAVIGVQEIATPAIPDVTLQGGEIIDIEPFRLQVLWTPGHSPGHVCLYEINTKTLFAGDFLLPHITPNISLAPAEGTVNPLRDYLNALNAVKAMDIQIVLPAHGRAFKNCRERIAELFLHHEERNDEILRILNGNTKTAYRIATEMTWMTDVGGAGWFTMDQWNRSMALMEALAHLEALYHDGRINRSMKEGVVLYLKT